MSAAPQLAHRPNIFEYFDYRKYLQDLFAYQKTVNNKFSLRSLAREISVAPSYFTMMLSGQVPLSDRVIELIEKPLDLRRHEVDFLRRLANLIDAKNLQEQKIAFQKITKFEDFKIEQGSGILAHQYFSKWYYAAIRELAKQPDFQEDPKWINLRLEKKVSLTEIREALRFLFKFGYIVKNEDKTYSVGESNLKCEGALYRLALADYYKQTYDLCVDSIYNTPSDERHLTSRTMTVSEEGFEEIRKILAESIEKLQKVTDSEKNRKDSKRVYHVSLATYPMSKKRGLHEE